MMYVILIISLFCFLYPAIKLSTYIADIVSEFIEHLFFSERG